MSPQQELNKLREVEKFDRVATAYSDLHAASVAASGEGVEYFAQYKLDCLLRNGVPASSRVLDFGCGIGNLTRLLASSFQQVTGYDPSAKSVEQAQQLGGEATYVSDVAHLDDASFDVMVLSGVLHHVPPDERRAVLEGARCKLRRGARVFVFEHNPLNPLTRRAVDACPFDDDAILLPAREVRSRLAEAGYGQVEQSFIVFFPKALSWLRPLEPLLGFCPLGAQTMTIGVVPG